MQSMTKINGNTRIKSMIRDAQTKSTDNILHLLVIRDKKNYKSALALLEYLMLNAPDAPNNPYNNLMILLGDAIEKYEQEYYPVPKAFVLEV